MGHNGTLGEPKDFFIFTTDIATRVNGNYSLSKNVLQRYFQYICVDKNFIEDNKIYLSQWKANLKTKSTLVNIWNIGCLQDRLKLTRVSFLRNRENIINGNT